MLLACIVFRIVNSLQQLGQKAEVEYWLAKFRFRSVKYQFLQTVINDGELLCRR